MTADAPNVLSEKLLGLSTHFDIPVPIRVLVVEDSRTVRHQLQDCLRQLDSVTVVEAETLAQARSLLEEGAERFFCAILDLTLPDASGSEVVELVQGFKLPSIVLTATFNPTVRAAVMERRVIDYMFKTSPSAIEDVAYLVGRLRQNNGMKVLVVDDSATFRHHLSQLLGQYLFNILTACDGEEALAQLAQHPDTTLVITDYHMPRMDGLELIRHIRRRFRREDLGVVALSDASHPELSAAMIKAGANDYLNKNFLLEEFYCRILQNVNMVRFVRQLRDMASRDPLTGLHNRRHLFEVAERELARTDAARERLVIGMVDADHFKRINDRHGHSTGDLALKKIAQAMRSGGDPGDVCARYGGEEFICLHRLAEGEHAAAYFEALRGRIEGLELAAGGERVPVTVSIGYAHAGTGSLAEIIDRADQAVYQAKAAGRNRVVAHPQQDAAPVTVPPCADS